MAGQPVLRALGAKIARLGGDHYIFDKVRSGETAAEIMAEFNLTRGMLYNWIHAGGDEREAEWDRARKDRAHALAEQALEIVDNPELETAPTSAEVNRANMRAKYRQWYAAKLNRAEYGDDALVNIHNQITTGDLHLDALLKHGLAAKATGEIKEADYELIEGEVEPAAALFDDEVDTWEDDS